MWKAIPFNQSCSTSALFEGVVGDVQKTNVAISLDRAESWPRVHLIDTSSCIYFVKKPGEMSNIISLKYI